MKSRYPWAVWLGSDGFTAVRGVDFHCSTKTFVNMLRQRTVGRGIKLRITVSPDDRVVEVAIYVAKGLDPLQEISNASGV